MVRVALLLSLSLACHDKERANAAGKVAEVFLGKLSAGDVDGARALFLGGSDLSLFGPMVEGLVKARIGPAQFKGLIDDTARFTALVATDRGPAAISLFLLEQRGAWKVARISSVGLHRKE